MSNEHPSTQDPAIFGAALRLLRGRKSLKQYHLADAAGVTKGMLSAYETGRQRPSLDTLEKILNSMGCDYADLQDALLAIQGSSPPQRDPRVAFPTSEIAPDNEATDRERRLGRALLEIARIFRGEDH